MPPPIWPDAASTTPATGSTWWAARYAMSSAADEPSLDADIDLTTDAVPDQTEKIVAGWADAVWLQGKRWGTMGARRGGTDDRDHDAPGRGLPSRFAQARRCVRRLHRGGPVAPGLHRQRHGPAAGITPRDRRPLRRPGRSGRRPAANAARSRGLVLRRSAPDAARRPFHRRSGPAARRRSGGRRSVHARSSGHRLGRADPRRAREAARGGPAVTGVVVRGRYRTGGGVPPRAAGPGPRAGPHPPAQGRPGPHPGRGGQDASRTPAPALGAAPRHRQTTDPGFRPRRRDLPSPRGRRGPDGP